MKSLLIVCSARLLGQTLLFNIPPWSPGPTRGKAHSPDCPGRRAGNAAPWVDGGGKDVQLLLQGCRTPLKDQEHRGCGGSCNEKGDIVLLGSPTKPVSLGKLPRATRQSQLAVAQIAWDCLSPARAAGVRGETVLAHVTYLIWKTQSPCVFSSLLLPTVQSADQLQRFCLAGMGQSFAFHHSGSCSFGFCCPLIFPIGTTHFLGNTFFFIPPYFTDLTICWGSTSLGHS